MVSIFMIATAAFILACPYTEHLSAEGSVRLGVAIGVEGTIWVADESGNSITVIDAATSKVVTRRTIG